MHINVIGECDKRPVIYTLMKICQELGDVLLITTDSRLLRLSDTRDTYGHYQNTMIAVTNEGLDDFLDSFVYDLVDFENVIIDNIVDPDADVVIYVKGYVQSENEKDMLEYLDDYKVIEPYTRKLLDSSTPYKLEEFESLVDMCVVAPKLAKEVADALSGALKVSTDNLKNIALKNTSVKVPKSSPLPFKIGGRK